VFQLLSKRLPGFSVPNWTSNVRVQGGHPHFLGEELADFVYQDTKGVLTSMLFPDEPKHVGQPFEYFIEVKSSSGAASEPFHFSRRQLEQVNYLPSKFLLSILTRATGLFHDTVQG